MSTALQAELDYGRIEQAITFIADHFTGRPSLAEIADHVHVSPFHFNRLFTHWAGTSPQRFLRFLTKEYAKEVLAASGDVLTAAYAAGLSGTGWLHDLFVTYEAMTPAQYRAQGLGLVIRYGFQHTPFGECLLGVTERGICALSFQPVAERGAALAALRTTWNRATIVPDDTKAAEVAAQLFLPGGGSTAPHLLLRGTNFQIKVWEALLRLQPGQLVSYKDVAVAIGQPGAGQAVGGAVGANTIGYLIPCHRVIQQNGGPGGYRWGTARKQALMGWEATRVAATR